MAKQSGNPAWRKDASGKGSSGNPGGRPKLDPEVVAALAAATLPAAQRLALLAQDGDPKVALAACLAILDRNGFKPKEAIGITDETPDRPHERRPVDVLVAELIQLRKARGV